MHVEAELRPRRRFRMPDKLGADHWRARAKEARELAEQMADDVAKAAMLEIAADYEKVADRALNRRGATRNASG